MESIRQKLVQMAKSPDNLLNPVIVALKRHVLKASSKDPTVKNKCPGALLSGVDKEIFTKFVSYAKDSLYLQNNILKHGNRVVVSKEVHCKMFRTFSNKFCTIGIKVLYNILKYEFLFLDAKLLNNHRECACVLSPIPRFHKVLSNVPQKYMMSCFTDADVASNEQNMQLLHKLVSQSRGRRPLNIILIIEANGEDASLKKYKSNSNVTVIHQSKNVTVIRQGKINLQKLMTLLYSAETGKVK